MSESKQWSPEGGGELIEQKRQKTAPKPKPADKSASKKAKEKK